MDLEFEDMPIGVVQPLRCQRKLVPPALVMKDTKRFYPRNTTAGRPDLTNSTDFYDTEFEMDDPETQSPPRGSFESFGRDSDSTLSTTELPTPESHGNDSFDFQPRKETIQGPKGPHLFRDSISSSIYALSSAEIDLYYLKSPAFLPKMGGTAGYSTPNTPDSARFMQQDVLSKTAGDIQYWGPSQIAHWLFVSGFDESVIETFIANDITGSVLLSLQGEDLKEIGITSFGKRHELLNRIQNLRRATQSEKSSPRKYDGCSASPKPPRSPKRRPYRYNVSAGQATNQEPVSIVGIEEVVPKPHYCPKGADCPKYQSVKRQMELLAAEHPGVILKPGTSIIVSNQGYPDIPGTSLQPDRLSSNARPSVVASSDVLGPYTAPETLSEETLNKVEHVDPQESVRQFLNYQHVELRPTIPPEEPPSSHQPTSDMDSNLRSLRAGEGESSAAQRTITLTAVQEHGPFSNAKTPTGCYRLGTPFSDFDVPITNIPAGPVPRETSQSVPPSMQYGNIYRSYQSPTMRSMSTGSEPLVPLRPLHSAGFPAGQRLRPVEAPENLHRGYRAQQQRSNSSTSDPEITKSGWMKKRKNAGFLRHEWYDAHFTLKGTNLAMHKDEIDALVSSRALENIDIDDYAVACSSLASSSKLTAALKRAVLRSGNNLGHGSDGTAFAFSLVPSGKENERKALFGKDNMKSHHFAVKSRDERIDWMRELMLAKALKKGKDNGDKMFVNGNAI
ncbi:hypothetical protein MAP00_008921 [Monascus purpureus]|nr:hypothetical protein MAP00_008921 [Monascus purpureus]